MHPFNLNSNRKAEVSRLDSALYYSVSLESLIIVQETQGVTSSETQGELAGVGQSKSGKNLGHDKVNFPAS